MRKVYIISLTLFLYQLSLYAYDEISTPTYPVKLPQSPNVSEFPIYGNIPVDYYTGTMSFSIPIFEINVDECKIPITLIYNATGIKVSQHSSNVGLGWVLDYGGIITSDCYGGNDFECWNEGYVCNSFINGIPEDSLFGYYSKTNMGVDISQKDTRPDIYHYSFCGYNGDMLFPPKEHHHPILIKSDKFLDITYNRDLQTWIIYDGNGNRFHFGNKPHISMNASFFNPPSLNCESSLTPQNNPGIGGYSWDYRSENAWPIDTIKTVNGRYIIFKYKRETLFTPMMPQEEIRIAHIADYGQCDVPNRSNYFSHSAANIIQSVPTEIFFPNGKVTFYSSQRLDIWEGQYAVYEDTDSPTKIDSIIVTNESGRVIKRAIFYYHYSGNTSSPNTCRLILDSVGGIEPQAYKFTYNNLQLPKKNSRQIDMWGYYNNSKAQSTWSTTFSNTKMEEGTLVPSMVIDNRTFYGRNRQCNAITVDNATLKEVVYPTGGRSVFEYEPHTFQLTATDAEIINDEQITKRTCLNLSVNFMNGNSVSVSSPADTCQVTLSDNDVINIHIKSEAIYGGPSSPVGIADLKIFNFSGALVFQQNIMLYSSSHEYDFHPSLSAGTYIISLTHSGTSSVSLPNPYNAMGATILVSEDVIYMKKSRGGNVVNYGGGLRIKSITNYDMSGIVLQRKEFNYQLNDTTPSGKLFVKPRFSHVFLEEFLHKLHPTIAPCNNFLCTLAASSMLVPAQPMVNPTIVGYSKVTETLIPQSENGKTEYIYQNIGANAPSEYPNFAAVPSPYNGNLLCQNFFDANNNIVRKHEYLYTYEWLREINGLHTIKLFPERYYNIANQQVSNVQLFKYSIRTFKPIKYTIKTTEFAEGGTMVTNTEYEYDSVSHLPNLITTYDNSDTIQQSIVYPSNNSSINAESLMNHFLYNKVLQRTFYHNGDNIMTSDYIYEEDNASKVLLKEIRQIKNENDSDSSLVFAAKSYDSAGNPTCILSQSHVPTALLWGCASMYPIVKIVGVEYEVIESAFSPDFLRMLEASCDVSLPMLKTVYDVLSSVVPNGDIHVYSYSPYVGLTLEIDSRGVVYSYEYDDYNRLTGKYIETDDGKIVVEKYKYHFQTK